MGVYVKGMKKPYTCYDCDFTDNNDNCFFGLGYALENRDCVYENCPLIEVKTPHGRLIDEGQIKTVYGEAMITRYQGYVSKTEKITHTDAPTVIEAEVE